MKFVIFVLSMFAFFGPAIASVAIGNSILLKLMFFLSSTLLLVTVIFSKKNIINDPFHPYVVYKIVIFFSLNLQVLVMDNSGYNFKETTYLAIFFTSISFHLLLEATQLLKLKLRLPNLFMDNLAVRITSRKIFLMLFLVGWVWRLYALSSGLLYGTLLATQLEITATSNLFGQLNNLSIIGLFGYVIFRSTQKITILIIALSLSEIAWGFFSGSKAAIIYVVLPMMFIFYSGGQIPIQKKYVVLLAAVAVFVVMLFPLVQSYRATVQSGFAYEKELSLKVSRDALENVFFGIGGEGKIYVHDTSVIERMNWARSFGLILERDNLANTKWYGASYLPIISWWIPRAIWEDKPTISVGLWFGREILGWSYLSRSEGAITLWGDAYMNFGWPGVIATQFFWLFLIISIFEIARSAGEWGVLFLATIYVRMFLGLEQNAASPLVAFQQSLLVIGLLYLLSKFVYSFNSRKVSVRYG